MKGFKFRLQSLLNVKEKMEDSIKKEFGKTIQDLNDEEDKLKSLIEYKEQTIENQRQFTTNKINPMVVKNTNNYLSKLDKDIEKQRTKVKEAEQRVEECRQRLLKATAERKGYDKLKEKEIEKFKIKSLMEEQKLLDEIVTMKTFKKSGEMHNGGN